MSNTNNKMNTRHFPKWVKDQLESDKNYSFDRIDGNIQGYIKALPGDENQEDVFFNADNLAELIHEFRIYKTEFKRFGIHY